MNGLVNWDALMKKMSQQMPMSDSKKANEMWSRFAPMYNFMAGLESKYTEKQVEKMILTENDTVLDVGCGIGRLTVPIAKKVKSVTAIDVADGMLDFCKMNVEQSGLKNVNIQKLDWNEAEVGKEIPKHDVVFASRSVGLKDIIKLNEAANKYAFLLSFAQYPSLRHTQLDLIDGIAGNKAMKPDPNERMFGYNIIFNLLYDLGIDPMVHVIDDGFERVYETKQAAYDDLGFLISKDALGEEISAEELELFKNNVDHFLTEKNDGKYRFLRQTKTFVIGWETKKL